MAFIPPAYFDTLLWGAREGGDPGDPNAALLEIRPGELDAEGSAQARIWYTFKQTTSWPLLAAIIGDLWAEQELAIGSVDQARYLSTAEGVQLDEIGLSVNRDRSGLSDTLYRLAIKAEARSIISSGTIPEIVELVRSLLGDDVVVSELFPRTLHIAAPDIPQDIFQVMIEVLVDVPVVTVQGVLSTFDPLLTQGWGSSTDPTATEIVDAGAWSASTGADADGPFALWSDGQAIG